MGGLQNLTGVIVGGIIGIAGVVIGKLLEQRQQRLSLMSALSGELRAILEVVEKRRILQALEGVIERMRRERTPLFFPFWFGNLHSLVFRQNADKLGSL